MYKPLCAITCAFLEYINLFFVYPYKLHKKATFCTPLSQKTLRNGLLHFHIICIIVGSLLETVSHLKAYHVLHAIRMFTSHQLSTNHCSRHLSSATISQQSTLFTMESMKNGDSSVALFINTTMVLQAKGDSQILFRTESQHLIDYFSWNVIYLCTD